MNLMFMNISGASQDMAMAASAGGGGSVVQTVIFFALMIGIFYFLLIRPQSKRAKEHREMVTALAKGDEVLTSGGVLGRIEEVKDNYIDIQIADNVVITVQKSHVSAVLPKGTMKSI